MAFTRDWSEATPDNGDNAKFGAQGIRYAKTDVADRVKELFYGFTAGENTYDAHAKKVMFREQASVAQPGANYGALYTKEVSGVAELFYQDENGTEKQLTTGGKLNVVTADIPADAVNQTHIQLANNANLVARNQAGTGDVNLIKATTSDVPELPDGSKLATSGAPTQDTQIANKKYVDDTIPQVTKSATAAKIVHKGGLIEQWFQITSTSDDPEAFTFPEAFPSTCIGLIPSLGISALTSVSKTGFTMNRLNDVEGTVTVYVHAIGY